MLPRVFSCPSIPWIAIVVASCAGLMVPARVAAQDPTDAEIQTAIRRGVEYLLATQNPQTAHGRELLGYTLFRCGVAADHPAVKNTIDRVVGSIKPTGYDPGGDHYYTAGCAAMLLSAIDGEKYREQLQVIANYITAGQNSSGGWNYPTDTQTFGDTSVTQYALLGLWAAHEAGIEVSPQVWDRAATWLRKTQVNDGFIYRPMGQAPGGIPSHSMTAAGTSTLLLCRHMLHPNAKGAVVAQSKPVNPAASTKKRYGLLEPIDVTRKPEEEKPATPARRDAPAASTSSLSDINSHARRGVSWIESNWAVKVPTWNYYYLYGLERLAAFGEIEKIGNHDWYLEGAKFLLAEQKPEGNWAGNDSPQVSTCFCLLFLGQATAQALNHPPRRVTKVGTGLLMAGRGLPDDLSSVTVKDGRVATLKTDEPITDLLAQLESGADADLLPIQEKIVETVQSEDREQLIGQTDRLIALLDSKKPEVRRIGLWALARGNDLAQAPRFIAMLADPDLDVAIEANRSLSFLSRRIAGVGIAVDPLAGLRDEKSEAEQKRIADAWRREATERWKNWYLTVRPYGERDDLLDRPAAKP